MKAEQILRLVWKEFVYGGHIFALSAISIVLVLAISLNILVTWDFLLVVYLIVYIVYLYDHSSNINEDNCPTNLERVRYLKNKKRIFPVILSSILTLTLTLIYFGGLLNLLFGLIILSLGLLYGSCFKKITRKVFFFKNFFVSFSWTMLVFFLIKYYSYPLTSAVLLLASFVFLRILAIQIFFDIKDTESDKKEKLLTLPVIFGRDKTSNIVKSISILSVLILFFCSYFGTLPNFLLFLFLLIPFNLYYLRKHQNLKSKHRSYLFAASEPIFWLLLVLSGKFLLW